MGSEGVVTHTVSGRDLRIRSRPLFRRSLPRCCREQVHARAGTITQLNNLDRACFPSWCSDRGHETAIADFRSGLLLV